MKFELTIGNLFSLSWNVFLFTALLISWHILALSDIVSWVDNVPRWVFWRRSFHIARTFNISSNCTIAINKSFKTGIFFVFSFWDIVRLHTHLLRHQGQSKHVFVCPQYSLVESIKKEKTVRHYCSSRKLCFEDAEFERNLIYSFATDDSEHNNKCGCENCCNYTHNDPYNLSWYQIRT